MTVAELPSQFFVHHTQVDRLWWRWQGRNKTRLNAYGGNTVQNTTIHDAKLSDELYMVGLAENRTVKDMMDTLSNGLCYTVSLPRSNQNANAC
jgi:tyrosinase